MPRAKPFPRRWAPAKAVPVASDEAMAVLREDFQWAVCAYVDLPTVENLHAKDAAFLALATAAAVRLEARRRTA